MQSHLAMLFLVIVVGPFTKWGVDYVTCNRVLAGGNKYIIVVVDYFTKWAEAMPTFKADGETTAFLCLTRSLLVFVFLKRFSLTMVVTFRIA